jgi:hypothetical protein
MQCFKDSAIAKVCQSLPAPKAALQETSVVTYCDTQQLYCPELKFSSLPLHAKCLAHLLT